MFESPINIDYFERARVLEKLTRGDKILVMKDLYTQSVRSSGASGAFAGRR